MPFTSSIVTFLSSSAFTVSCNDRWCTDAGPQQALQPSFTPRHSGVRDESASRITVELCACARAMDYSREGTYREALLRTLSGCRVLYSVSLGTGSLGLRDRSAIPASVPGPVWLSATGHRACPRVRRRAQPARPLSTTARRALRLSSCIHTPAMCTIPQACDILGRTAFIDRERRLGCIV
jgi:hypothetical protein